MTIQKVTVVGAGTMGNGIAHVFAQHGFEVVLADISLSQLEKAKETIEKNLDRQVTKSIITQEVKEKALQLLATETNLPLAVASADLVIEAATENIETKKNLFRILDEAAPSKTILASNTSSISITQLAAATKRPEQVIGMHFMNPVPVMKLVEIINGYATDKSVTQTVESLTVLLGKTPCLVNDYPGFIANRILMPMINEAIYSLYESVAGVASIDNIMKLGMAHPMGPLQLADFIGLDVCLNILKVMQEGLGNPKYAPCPLLVNMVMAGKLGVKSSEGFYMYPAGTKDLIVSTRFSN